MGIFNNRTGWKMFLNFNKRGRGGEGFNKYCSSFPRENLYLWRKPFFYVLFNATLLCNNIFTLSQNIRNLKIIRKFRVIYILVKDQIIRN